MLFIVLHIDYRIVSPITWLQSTEIWQVKNAYTTSTIYMQMINIMEVNWVCMEQEIK